MICVFRMLPLFALLLGLPIAANAGDLFCFRIFGCDKDEGSLGTIQLDFYRTFEEKSLLGIFPYKDHSISKWRIKNQVKLLNAWFDGRVDFELGEIFSYDGNPALHVIESENYDLPCTLVREVALSGEMNADRISVVVSSRFSSPERALNGCAAAIDTPLGGITIPVGDPADPSSAVLAPAVIVTMSNNGDLPGSNNPALGTPTILGVLLAHEIGHILGLRHTARIDTDYSTEGVEDYNECGELILYPYFCGVELDCDGPIDPLTGERYVYSDWEGRSNLMTTAGALDVFSNVAGIGLFKNNYADIFQAIIECWFSRRRSST